MLYLSVPTLPLLLQTPLSLHLRVNVQMSLCTVKSFSVQPPSTVSCSPAGICTVCSTYPLPIMVVSFYSYQSIYQSPVQDLVFLKGRECILFISVTPSPGPRMYIIVVNKQVLNKFVSIPVLHLIGIAQQFRVGACRWTVRHSNPSLSMYWPRRTLGKLLIFPIYLL